MALEEHEIAFPVSGNAATGDLYWTLGDGHAIPDAIDWAAAAFAQTSAA